jgi:nitrogen fixation protein NifU and related proteins
MQSELELDELYRELILDHYKRPHHRDRLSDPDVTAEGYNPVCGDEIEMELDFDGDTLTSIGVRGRGCSISQASASMMSDVVEGKTVNEIRHLSDEFTGMMRNGDGGVPEDLGDIEALQGVAKFPVRVKCATLAWHTLGEGIQQHEKGATAARIEEI